MKKVYAGVLFCSFACAAILCWCWAGPPTDFPRGPVVVAHVYELHAELRNASIREDQSIEVDFVLINDTSFSIRLAERWKSWGANQWKFRVADADGHEYLLSNPQTIWFANCFTTFTIIPGGEHVMRCRLDRSPRAHSDGEVCIFTEPHSMRISQIVVERGGQFRRSSEVTETGECSNSWMFPVSIVGTFSSVCYERSEWTEGTNWAGTVRSAPLTINADPTGLVNKPGVP